MIPLQGVDGYRGSNNNVGKGCDVLNVVSERLAEGLTAPRYLHVAYASG